MLEELLQWAEEKLIALPEMNSDIFALRIMNYLINACSNTVTLRISDTNFIGLSLEFAQNILNTILKKYQNLALHPSNLTDIDDENLFDEFENVIGGCIKPISR